MAIKSGTRAKKSGTRGKTSPADLARAGATHREFRSKAYRQAVWSLDEISPDLGEPFDEMLGGPASAPESLA
ncbi:MAG TPA: hypothetical protein VM848_18885 [Acidimicrobiia bacterium]|nr:hypothetical protein [Acidimicrobiia bacterium]